MAIEILSDIIEELADDLGIYGAHSVEHPDSQCECRCCWTSDIRSRILRAVEIERKLNAPEQEQQS